MCSVKRKLYGKPWTCNSVHSQLKQNSVVENINIYTFNYLTVCHLRADFPVSVPTSGYKGEKEEKINQNTGFQLRELQADCQGSGMFSKLCLHTMAFLFSQFLHYSAVFILLEIQ